MSMYSGILRYTYQTTRQTLHTVVNKFEIPAGRLLSNGCSQCFAGSGRVQLGRRTGRLPCRA